MEKTVPSTTDALQVGSAFIDAPRMRLKRCCGAVFEGEDCDCAEIVAQMHAAPIIYVPAVAR